jgi:uncharacterized membrane protein YkvA (DUF1232 family)
MPRARKPKATARRGAKLFTSEDFRAHLTEKASLIAPADVETLVARTAEASERAAAAAEDHPLLARQVDVALQLLADHDAGACPQIPFWTVSLLTAATFYLLDPMDVVPDWIAGIGTSDDALIYELAFEMGAPGIERYCTWKDISVDGLFAKPKTK